MASYQAQKSKFPASFHCHVGILYFFLLSGLLTHSSGWNPGSCPRFGCQCFWRYNLKWTDCSGCHLYDVYTGTDDAVQALDVSSNFIPSLADYELRDAGLSNLKLLNLSSNAIKEIGLKAFYNLSELKVLDLSKNHLYFLLPETFVNNHKLEILVIAWNNLNRHVPKLRSSSLASLDLRNCGLSHLPLDTFAGLPRLRTLILSDNVMIQLDPDILKGLPNLGILTIERNPWICNNEMREMEKRLKAKRVMFKPVCSADVLPIAKKSEKMIVAPTTQKARNVNHERLIAGVKIWRNLSRAGNSSKGCRSSETGRTPGEDEFFASDPQSISPWWFFAIGFILGSAIATMSTYFWLTRTLTIPIADLNRSSSRDRPESPRIGDEPVTTERANLLQYLWLNGDDDANRSSIGCPGTPPPPYRDVILHAHRYPRPNLGASLIFPDERSSRQIES